MAATSEPRGTTWQVSGKSPPYCSIHSQLPTYGCKQTVGVRLLLTRAAHHAAVRLLWLATGCTTATAKVNCSIAVPARHGSTGNGLSSAARIKSLRRGSICQKHRCCCYLDLLYALLPKPAKTACAIKVQMILVPGSSKYSTIKCLSSRSVSNGRQVAVGSSSC